MKYLKIRDDEHLVPVETIYDLIASDKRKLFFTVEDKPRFFVTYPNSDPDIQSIKIIRIMPDEVTLDIIPNVGYKLDKLDLKKYSAGHFVLLKEYHNEAATGNLLRKIVCDGFLTHPEDTILRVLTEDNRVYVVYQGTIFYIGLTLRLSKVIGDIPNPKVVEIQVGPYEATTMKFVYEKLTVPKRELKFE